jgi:hypothetical protein
MNVIEHHSTVMVATKDLPSQLPPEEYFAWEE